MPPGAGGGGLQGPQWAVASMMLLQPLHGGVPEPPAGGARGPSAGRRAWRASALHSFALRYAR